jgi:hypothetical protein
MATLSLSRIARILQRYNVRYLSKANLALCEGNCNVYQGNQSTLRRVIKPVRA